MQDTCAGAAQHVLTCTGTRPLCCLPNKIIKKIKIMRMLFIHVGSMCASRHTLVLLQRAHEAHVHATVLKESDLGRDKPPGFNYQQAQLASVRLCNVCKPSASLKGSSVKVCSSQHSP